MPDNNQETQLTVANQIFGLLSAIQETESTSRQWLEYAARLVQENADPAEIMSALTVVDTNQNAISEVMGQAHAMIGAMGNALTEALDQRDEALEKIDELEADLCAISDERDTLQSEVESARQDAEDAFNEGVDHAYDSITSDPEYDAAIIESYKEDFLYNAKSLATRLRDAGKTEEADELENTALTADELREKTEELQTKLYSWLWNNRNNIAKPE